MCQLPFSLIWPPKMNSPPLQSRFSKINNVLRNREISFLLSSHAQKEDNNHTFLFWPHMKVITTAGHPWSALPWKLINTATDLMFKCWLPQQKWGYYYLFRKNTSGKHFVIKNDTHIWKRCLHWVKYVPQATILLYMLFLNRERGLNDTKFA